MNQDRDRDRDELRRRLEQLQSQLDRTSSRDPRQQEMLDRLQADVRKALADETADTSSLRARLEDTIAHFEASHPDLARNIAQVIDALALFGL